MGDAHIKLGQYLRRYWVAYSPKKFKAPYVTVVQSSGFGKSRMLRELALSAKVPGMNMKVSYMCMRDRTSTGYLEATLKLREWLFNPLEDAEVKDISERLKTIFYYAIENWGAVQEQWAARFSEANADAVAAETLANSLMSRRTTSAKTKRSYDHKRTPGEKMVVLVVDEARSLLRGRSDGGLNLFRKLRKALVSASMDIDGGGVFAVLVDTNFKISDLSPPWVSEPSFKVTRGRLASFPPFVLAHTMDANWHKCCRDGLRTRRVLRAKSSDSEEEEKDDSDSTGNQVKGDEQDVTMEHEIAEYKHIVTRRGKRKAQNALLRMGRPMCYSNIRSSK